MKVLVTGGAGFIGSHVVDALVSRGDDVVCLDSLDPGVHRMAPEYLNPLAEHCFVDLRWWGPDARFSDIEAVVHCAALGGVGRASREPFNVVEANVAGTARLIEHMYTWTRLERVVLASSFSVYGSSYRYRCVTCGAERDGQRRTEDLERGRFEVLCNCGGTTAVVALDESVPPSPLERYGASKLMQELAFRGFEVCPVKVLRQSSVYGPRLRLDDGEATIIARIAGWIRAGIRPPLLEDGCQIRDWVSVTDSVAAIVALLDGTPAPDVVNVCTGVGTTLRDACQLIAGALGSTCEPDIVGGYRIGDMRHCLGDPSTLTDLLGRAPLALDDAVADSFAEPLQVGA